SPSGDGRRNAAVHY
ncbi:conjugative coupling factor TraD, SXT/TOL subfamily protein, partial [Vibrio cholerae CP1035(8)]